MGMENSTLWLAILSILTPTAIACVGGIISRLGRRLDDLTKSIEDLRGRLIAIEATAEWRRSTDAAVKYASDRGLDLERRLTVIETVVSRGGVHGGSGGSGGSGLGAWFFT